MNMEEKREKLDFMQKFFVKSFIVSFVILLVSTLLCIVMHDYQLAVVTKFFAVDEEDLGKIIILTMGIWKVLIVQFTLVPALVIWCMKHCCKCMCKK